MAGRDGRAGERRHGHTAGAAKGGVDGSNSNAFLAKLNPGGSALVYSTYLGGSQEEEGYSIAVDSSGNAAYVTGYTLSTNFRTANPLQPANGGKADAFVAKLVGLRASKCKTQSGSALKPTGRC